MRDASQGKLQGVLAYNDLPLVSVDFKAFGYSLHVCVLRPESRGAVSLASNDIKDAPIIDFNFFSDTNGKDRDVLVNGLKQARKILAAPAFDKHRGEELFPGDAIQSDDELFEKAKDTLGLVYHPVGTCKMGTDEMAVVDTTLKVYGIKKLRVVDGSIMPTLTSGNTNAPIIAIAEKAAEMILSD
jgi:choline dehydrogenase-like flavoprotein